jgi:hypothetical protein
MRPAPCLDRLGDFGAAAGGNGVKDPVGLAPWVQRPIRTIATSGIT